MTPLSLLFINRMNLYRRGSLLLDILIYDFRCYHLSNNLSSRIDSKGLESVAAVIVLLSFDRVSSHNNNVAMKVLEIMECGTLESPRSTVFQ